MTDRELLEMAAKAAGLRYHAYIDDSICGTGINIGDIDVPLWNPLEDDGDALRLAVKLDIDIAKTNDDLNMHDERMYCTVTASNQEGFEAVEHELDDPCAATRRAIVRAAAEIGKAQP